MSQATKFSSSEALEALGRAFEELSTPIADTVSRTKWTRLVLLKVAQLGCEYGFTPCASRLKASEVADIESAWLYDFVWYSNCSAERHLSEVPLVLESEWGNLEAIRYDFEKLLLAKAGLKVMVFEAADHAAIAIIESFLRQGIRRFTKRSDGETYLFAAFNNDARRFEISQVEGT